MTGFVIAAWFVGKTCVSAKDLSLEIVFLKENGFATIELERGLLLDLKEPDRRLQLVLSVLVVVELFPVAPSLVLLAGAEFAVVFWADAAAAAALLELRESLLRRLSR